MEAVWFLSGIYILPAHRKHNITSLLVEYAIQLKRSSKSGIAVVPSTAWPLFAVFQGIVSLRMERLMKYYSTTLDMLPKGRMYRRKFCDLYSIPTDEELVDEDVIVIERRERAISPTTGSARL